MKSVITLVSNSKGLVKYLFLFLVFLNVILSAGYSQSKIHGKILDTTGKPVSNANVLLLNSKDSVLVKGMLTTEEGTYSFENVNTGAYLISATHTGANLVYSKPFEIVLKTETINLGILRLEESSVVLAGVTVTAKKPLFEQKIDRMVINVAASITYAGTNALDVLERSPGIIVNRFTNSLSINGKSGVIVMINGKRNYMDIAAIIQMLAGMPSDNIERIEVITTPPANYDADGNAGIINIVLKSNNQFGTNGSYSLTAGYNKGEQNSLSINMNHRKGKINLFGNYTYSRTRLYQLWTNYHAVDNGGIFMENYSESNRNGLVWLHDGQAGIDYQVTKKTIVGVLFTGSYRHWSMVADNYSYIYNNHELDTSVSIINNELHTTGSYGINFNLQNYTSAVGEEASWKNYDTANYLQGGGAPGPENAVNRSRSVAGAYVEWEAELSDHFLFNAAARYEYYSDFGGNIAGKLAARYKFSNQFMLRASVNNGFRAPSLQQRYTMSIAGSLTGPSRSLTITGMFPNDHAVIRTLAIPLLTAEKSFNISGGFTSSFLNHFNLTADAYWIQIKNRIVLSGSFERIPGNTIDAILDPYPAFKEIRRISFFTNAINTITKGIDIVLDGNWNSRITSLGVSLAANFNSTRLFGDIETSNKLAANPQSASTLFNSEEITKIEKGQPGSKIILSMIYRTGKIKLIIRNTRFGKTMIATLGSPPETFSSKILTDISLDYSLKTWVTITAGANNIANIYPDRLKHYENTSQGSWIYSPEASPFGFNGGYYFLNLNFNFLSKNKKPLTKLKGFFNKWELPDFIPPKVIHRNSVGW